MRVEDQLGILGREEANFFGCILPYSKVPSTGQQASSGTTNKPPLLINADEFENVVSLVCNDGYNCMVLQCIMEECFSHLST